jgi:hypothetical protein
MCHVCILHIYKVIVLSGSVNAVSQYWECHYNHCFRVESVTGLESCLLCQDPCGTPFRKISIAVPSLLQYILILNWFICELKEVARVCGLFQ